MGKKRAEDEKKIEAGHKPKNAVLGHHHMGGRKL